MNENQQVAGEIARILSDDLLLDVDAEADLVESGTLDSVNVVRLLAAIEERFGITLPIDELNIDTFRSTRAIAECVARGLKESAEQTIAIAVLQG